MKLLWQLKSKSQYLQKHIFEKYIFFSELSEHMEWGMKFHDFQCIIRELFWFGIFDTTILVCKENTTN